MSKNNVIYLLHEYSTTHPEKVVFRWGKNDTISYKEFVQKIGRIASGLKSLGIEKGDRVLIFLPLSIDLYSAMFSIQQIGAIAVFLDSWARKDQLNLCAEIASPKAIISFEKAYLAMQGVEQLDKIPVKVVVGEHEHNYSSDFQSLVKSGEECGIEEVELNDTALITFTTGSSGVPKGANRTHKFLAAQHKALKKVIPYLEEDTDLPTFPIFALNNLASGTTTILPKIDLANPSERDGEILASQIFSGHIRCTTLSPSLFIKVARFCYENDMKLSSLRRIVTGGAPISRDNVAQFKKIAPGAKILVLYGSTEVEPIAHIEANEMLSDLGKKEGVNVGCISDDLEYKFIRITKESVCLTKKGWSEWEVSNQEVGELIVTGPHVCQGYYNNKGAFSRAKIQGLDGKIWHRTGDLGSLDERGCLWFVGRVHNAIFRDGIFLFPVQAELLLKKIPQVKQAAFLGISDLKLHEKTCVVISIEDEASEMEVKQEVLEHLKQHQIPVDEIEVVSHIPMDPRHHSKVEYEKLREVLL